MPNVLFISTTNNGVTYYRQYGFLQRMSELNLIHGRMFPEWNGNVYDADWWEGKFQEYLPTIEFNAKWADMVVVQYVSTPGGVAIVEGLRDTMPCYMECDDYFGGVPAYSGAFHDNKPGDRQDYWGTRQLMESSGVIAPTVYLANSFKKYNSKTKVIPNCIDFNIWNHTQRVKKDKLNIGWVGGGSHDGDLKLVKDVVYDILREYKDVTFTIASSPPPSWPKHERLNLLQMAVPINKYPDAVKKLGFDIGLAPLRDNYFNRAKSNLRYLEYSAMKIPTIASNVEPFKHKFVGLIAKDEYDWYGHIAGLIENEEQRIKLGEYAYECVYENFNLDTVSRDYANFIQEVIDAR